MHESLELVSRNFGVLISSIKMTKIFTVFTKLFLSLYSIENYIYCMTFGKRMVYNKRIKQIMG